MKITAVSDLHGNLPNIPECDLLVIAGDVCPDNHFTLRNNLMCANEQADWLRGEYIPWLRAQPFKTCVFIWGNHDFVGEYPAMLPPFSESAGKEVVLLQDSGHIVKVGDEVIRVWGAPWVGNLPKWAFNKPQNELTEKWRYIPDNLDILMTHAPPFGIGDFCRAGNVGDPGLAHALTNPITRPLLHFFGHIHEGRGAYRDGMYNVSYVDGQYKPYDLPIKELEYVILT